MKRSPAFVIGCFLALIAAGFPARPVYAQYELGKPVSIELGGLGVAQAAAAPAVLIVPSLALGGASVAALPAPPIAAAPAAEPPAIAAAPGLEPAAAELPASAAAPAVERNALVDGALEINGGGEGSEAALKKMFENSSTRGELNVASPGPKQPVADGAAAKTAEELILEDPVREYEKYHARLKKYGPNAPFPEFKPAVETILNALKSEDVKATLSRGIPDLQYELQEVLTQIFHVNLAFKYDDKANYPYDDPFAGPFPYRPTIDAIESGLRLLDKIERLNNPKTVPLYHFNRYAYHRHSLLADPDVVIFPTAKSLSFENLIRVRSVPIGFVGVVAKTVRVDRHYQSPLDFWYHDLNHVRRMCAYLARRAARRGARTDDEKAGFYREMDDFLVQKIIPNIQKLPAGASEEERWVRSLTRVIIFEIVHETALTAERDTILQDLVRGPDVPQPFEHMLLDSGFNPADIETQLRTPTGNLRSGADLKLGAGMSEPTAIRYFHDRALSLLANVYNKLLAGFYDDVDAPKNYVAPPAARKADYLVKAAQGIMRFLGAQDQPDAAVLRALVLSKEGSPEKFKYKMLAPHEADVEKSAAATPPPASEEAIRQALPSKGN